MTDGLEKKVITKTEIYHSRVILGEEYHYQYILYTSFEFSGCVSIKSACGKFYSDEYDNISVETSVLPDNKKEKLVANTITSGRGEALHDWIEQGCKDHKVEDALKGHFEIVDTMKKLIEEGYTHEKMRLERDIEEIEKEINKPSFE